VWKSLNLFPAKRIAARKRQPARQSCPFSPVERETGYVFSDIPGFLCFGRSAGTGLQQETTDCCSETIEKRFLRRGKKI
jgi:hypothetical protein